MESLASWAFGFFGIEGIENDGVHQLPVDGFTTWTGCGFPIAILLFSLRFSVEILFRKFYLLLKSSKYHKTFKVT